MIRGKSFQLSQLLWSKCSPTTSSYGMMLARVPSLTSSNKPASKLQRLPFAALRDPYRMRSPRRRSPQLEPRRTKLVAKDRRLCCRRPSPLLPIGRMLAPKPRRMLVCQRKNGKGSLHSSTVERGGARFSTVHWGAGSVIHVAMLISVSSVVKTTLGTGTTEFTAPPSLPGIGSTRRLDQGRSALMMRRWIHGPPLTKLPTQTAQRPVWKSWNEVPRDVDEVARHGPWFLEIFSGTARLTAAVRALGVPCLPPGVPRGSISFRCSGL